MFRQNIVKEILFGAWDLHTFIKRIVTSEMHQNRTESPNSLSEETFYRSPIKLTISQNYELVR